MAKKKSGGTSIGLILTLIFFVLATFIAGTVAYFGYSEQEQFKAEAKKAQEAQKTAEALHREERIRRVMLRIAIGTEEPGDRVLLVQELEPLRPQIKDEYDRMKRGLADKVPLVPDPKDKTKQVSAFNWPLLSMTSDAVKTKTEGGFDAETAKGDPDVAPALTIPNMIGIFITKAEQAEKLKVDAIAARDQAQKDLVAKEASKANDKKIYDDALAKIQGEVAAKYAKLDADYQAMVAKHKNDGAAAADRVKGLGVINNNQADELAKFNDKVKGLQELIAKFQDQGSGSSRTNAVGVDLLNMEEKKGEIVRREEGGFVAINLGASKKLRPQVTFLVVRSDISWLALMDREESLKRNSYRQDRQPFEDNPYVKAGIEIVEVTGQESSRAKILFENEPIRNPIQPKDQIFNLAWQPAEEIRVAFAGIIDLDGDGLDNNEDFLRMLERQGVVVDEYLKLKPLEFVKRDGKGMSLRTKYLIIAENPKLDALPTNMNTPQGLQIVETIKAMSDIRNRARENGVQVIDANKFLAMIGFKLPKNPVPPQYGAGAYIDQGAPPKKEGN